MSDKFSTFETSSPPLTRGTTAAYTQYSICWHVDSLVTHGLSSCGETWSRWRQTIWTWNNSCWQVVDQLCWWNFWQIVNRTIDTKSGYLLERDSSAWHVAYQLLTRAQLASFWPSAILSRRLWIHNLRFVPLFIIQFWLLSDKSPKIAEIIPEDQDVGLYRWYIFVF